MPTLIIAGDQSGVGKTSLAAGLLVQLAGEGRSSAYYKPFSSTADDADVRLALFEPLAVILGPAPVTALPDASRMGDVSAAVRGLREQADTTVVELADGLDPADFAQALDARVLMVLRYSAGTVGDFSATADALGERLAAAVVNAVPAYRADDVAAQTASAGFTAPVVALPESRFMLAPTVAEIAAHLGGEWVLDPVNSDAPVEHYLIGGNIMDSGPNYFGRYANQAVIARTQRPDILLAAMSPETRCLVLTGPGETNEYIKAEARERDIPLIRVAASTVEAAESLAGLRANACGMAKARHFADLIASHTSPEMVGWLGLASWLGRNSLKEES